MQVITLKWLREVDVCDEAVEAFTEYTTATDPIRILRRLMHPKTRMMIEHDYFGSNTLDWAVWLIVELLNHEDRVRMAIFAAESVLPIYEDYDPYDRRPRNAIEAAISWLDDRDQACACKYASERVDESLTYLSRRVLAQKAVHDAAWAAKRCALTAAVGMGYNVRSTTVAAYYAANDREAGYKLQRKIIRYGIQLIEERG